LKRVSVTEVRTKFVEAHVGSIRPVMLARRDRGQARVDVGGDRTGVAEIR